MPYSVSAEEGNTYGEEEYGARFGTDTIFSGETDFSVDVIQKSVLFSA